MTSRRQLNTLTDRVRRDRADERSVGTVKTRMSDEESGELGALFDLEAVCANPACRHERGFHLATATSAACGYSGCGCQDFQQLEADPFGHLVGDPDDPELPGEPQENLCGALIDDGVWCALLAGHDGRHDADGEPADEGPDIIGEIVVAPGHPIPVPQPGGPRIVLSGTLAEHGWSEPIAQQAPVDASSGPVSDDPGEVVETSVLFPVVAAGHPAVALDRLLDPAHRVADIVEALEPMLAPPLAVQQLQILVEEASGVEVTDQASYDRACDLYERLAENEKGIEETIGPVVGFFHRPWKALCEFRARFAKPVAEQKKRLSDIAGAWQLAEKKRAEEQARRDAEAAAAAERERLRLVEAEARTAAATLPAESSLAQMLEQTAVQAQTAQLHVVPVPVPAAIPPRASAGTGNRKSKVAVIEDYDAFYKGLVDDSTRRIAAPIDQAYLNKQACDLGDELAKRFPGVKAVDKGGLTAKGRR